MPTQEQQSQAQSVEETREPENTELHEQHFKTLAVRIEEDLHAQLRFIAQLSGTSISEEIRTAIQSRITTAQDDPELIARAEQARNEIEREAAARAAAIAGFIGKPATDAAVGALGSAASKARRTAKTNNRNQ